MPDSIPSPAARGQTLRQEISSLLTASPCSCRDLSRAVGQSEKQVLDHLEHIRRSLRADRAMTFTVEPACCRSCAFTFDDRERLAKPGKCPSCRGTQIEPPLFSITETDCR